MARVACERLRVLSWAGGWGRALREAVSDPFEREHGVRVEHVSHVGLELPPDVLAALGRGERPRVDVIWSNALPALRAQRDGHSSPLDPAELPVLRELRPRARPEGGGNGAFAAVHPYVVYYVLAYHEAAFPAGPPASWRALLDRAPGRLALYPGGNGFYPIAQVMGGGRLADIPRAMEPCWSFLRELWPQIGELAYSVGMEHQLASGALESCFRALTNALAFRAAGLPIRWCVPGEGTTDTVDALWLPRGLPDAERDAAQRYLAFALRPDVQSRWCAALGAMPVHPGARIPPALVGRPGLPRDADDRRGILHVPESVKLAHQADWEARFASIGAGCGARPPGVSPPR